MPKTLPEKYQQLVEHFGSQENTAQALGVKQPAVSCWVRGTKKMSELVAMRAQAETNGAFEAVDLCPALKGCFEKLIA